MQPAIVTIVVALAAGVLPVLKLPGAEFGWDIFQRPWLSVLGMSAIMFLWGLFLD